MKSHKWEAGSLVPHLGRRSPRIGAGRACRRSSGGLWPRGEWAGWDAFGATQNARAGGMRQEAGLQREPRGEMESASEEGKGLPLLHLPRDVVLGAVAQDLHRHIAPCTPRHTHTHKAHTQSAQTHTHTYAYIGTTLSLGAKTQLSHRAGHQALTIQARELWS